MKKVYIGLMMGERFIMHIVLVTIELATSQNVSGGLASFTANMARIYAAHKHKVTILLCTFKEQSLTFDEGIGLENVFVKKEEWNILDKITKVCMFGKRENVTKARRVLVNIYKSSRVRKKIKEINKKDKIDIVHYCNLGALAFWAGKTIPYVVRISGFAGITQEAKLPGLCKHIKYDSNKITTVDKIAEYTLKKARYIISPSNLLADIGKQNLGIEATVIESPFVLSKMNWDYEVYDSIVKDKKYIIHYGRLCYLKGTHIVAELVNELLQTFPNIYLVLVGNNAEYMNENGEEITADKLVKKKAGEFSERVIYAGVLVREQLYPLIEKAELCLLPSRIENLPNACIEAMAMRQIVVATNGASYEQLIDDKVNGFLCERDNPDSYLNAVKEALKMSTEDKERMRSKAQEVTERLTPQKIYEKYIEFYKKVIREW